MEEWINSIELDLKGHPKHCKNCGEFFRAGRKNTKYCSSKCRNQHYRKRLKRKARVQVLLSVFGLGKVKQYEKKPEPIKKKVDYSRLTFILSFIGFLGSIGFYIGVLREVYSPARDKQRVEQLEVQNERLEQTIQLLIEQKGE